MAQFWICLFNGLLSLSKRCGAIGSVALGGGVGVAKVGDVSGGCNHGGGGAAVSRTSSNMPSGVNVPSRSLRIGVRGMGVGPLLRHGCGME